MLMQHDTPANNMLTACVCTSDFLLQHYTTLGYDNVFTLDDGSGGRFAWAYVELITRVGVDWYIHNTTV